MLDIALLSFIVLAAYLVACWKPKEAANRSMSASERSSQATGLHAEAPA